MPLLRAPLVLLVCALVGGAAPVGEPPEPAAVEAEAPEPEPVVIRVVKPRAEEPERPAAPPAAPWPPEGARCVRDPPVCFAPPGPPMGDPPQPFDFHPGFPVFLHGGPNGTLERGGPQDLDELKPEPCTRNVTAVQSSEHSDANRNRLADDFEEALDALPEHATWTVLVQPTCPATWNHVRELRGDLGHFPMVSLWSFGGFAADLTVEQVRGLAARSDVVIVEGNRLAQLFLEGPT